jgi:hypothetical protein
MSYQSNRSRSRRPEPRRSRTRALGCLVALIWIVLAVVLGYQYYLRPRVSEEVGREISRQIGAGPPGATDVTGQIREGAGQALPTAIAALPAGELRLSEQEANAYIAANPAAVAPLDTARVRFVPGRVETDIAAFGIAGTASTELAVQGGRVVTVNPALDGPIGSLISLEDLVRPLEQQLNDQLAAQGRRITDVRVEPGILIVTVE